MVLGSTPTENRRTIAMENGGLMGFNGDLMGFNGIYDGIPSGK